jgi:hypothetical protein
MDASWAFLVSGVKGGRLILGAAKVDVEQG